LSFRVSTHMFRVSLAFGIFYSSQRLHMEVNTSRNYCNINTSHSGSKMARGIVGHLSNQGTSRRPIYAALLLFMKGPVDSMLRETNSRTLTMDQTSREINHQGFHAHSAWCFQPKNLPIDMLMPLPFSPWSFAPKYPSEVVHIVGSYHVE
jgi:hypothetical protein